MIEGMLYILRVACPWRDLPEWYGPWSSVYSRWRRWNRSGLWARILEVVSEMPEGALVHLDATHVKTHQDATNPRGGQARQAIGRTRGGLNTQVTALVDSKGRAIQLIVDFGNQADIRCADRLYALSDAMTSVTAVVSTAGAVQERYGYDGFGAVRYMTPAFGSSTSSYAWETLFDGYRYDSDTGLYQVRYRYLHPQLGRWLSRDPIEEQGGLNLYLYCSNKPLTFLDSDGRFCLPGYVHLQSFICLVAGTCKNVNINCTVCRPVASTPMPPYFSMGLKLCINAAMHNWRISCQVAAQGPFGTNAQAGPLLKRPCAQLFKCFAEYFDV